MGQTREEALNAFLKAHGDPRGKSVEELRREQAVDGNGLTAEERRIWREACERIARGFQGIAPKVGEQYYIGVIKKIVVTEGSYPDFKIVLVKKFKTHEEQQDFLEEIYERKS